MQASRWLDESHEEQEATADVNVREGASGDGHALSSRGTHGGNGAENGLHADSDDSRSGLDSEDGSDEAGEEQRQPAK